MFYKSQACNHEHNANHSRVYPCLCGELSMCLILCERKEKEVHIKYPRWAWAGMEQRCSWHGWQHLQQSGTNTFSTSFITEPRVLGVHSLTVLPVGESSLCFLDKLTVGRREVRVQHRRTDTVYVLLWQSVRRAERLARSSSPKGKRTIRIRVIDVPQDRRMGILWQYK